MLAYINILKKKKKHKPIMGEKKKALDTVEINVKMLWT